MNGLELVVLGRQQRHLGEQLDVLPHLLTDDEPLLLAQAERILLLLLLLLLIVFLQLIMLNLVALLGLELLTLQIGILIDLKGHTNACDVTY